MLPDIVDLTLKELDVRAKNRAYLTDPVAWATEYLGVQLWRKQREILQSLVDNRQTAVKAGHSTGKSFVSAIAIAWWIDVHPPEHTFVASTAPSSAQLGNVWDTLRKLHSLSKERYLEYQKRIKDGRPTEGFPDHPLPGYITHNDEWKMLDGTTIAQGRKPPDGKSDTGFQGRHAPYLFALGDEAVGLPDELVSSLGNIATGRENRQLLIMNPTDPSSYVARIWRDDDSDWNKMTISSWDSPAIVPDPNFDMSLVESDGGLATLEFIEQKKKEYGGEEDPRYIARVLGEWAFDKANTVFTEREIAMALNRVVIPDGSPLQLGVDLSRMGSDSTFVYSRERGDVWTSDKDGNPVESTGQTGFRIRKVGEWRKAPLVGTNPENLGSDQRVHELALGLGAEVVKLDEAGLGSGAVDSLVELSDRHEKYLVIGVLGAKSAQDKRAYINARAELFFTMKRAMGEGRLDLDPEDEEMIDELRGITYSHRDGGILKIDSKEELRKEMKKSPDRADAVTYAFLDLDGDLENPLLGVEPGDVLSFDPMNYFNDFILTGEGRPL